MEKTKTQAPLLGLEECILNWFADEKTKCIENAGPTGVSDGNAENKKVQKASPKEQSQGCRRLPLFVQLCTGLYALLLVAVMAYAFLLAFCEEACHACCNNSCVLLIVVLILATIVLVFLWNCHIRLREVEAHSVGTDKVKNQPVSFRDALDKRFSDEYIDSFVRKVVKDYSRQDKLAGE